MNFHLNINTCCSAVHVQGRFSFKEKLRCFEISDISSEQGIVVKYTKNLGYFFLVVMNGKSPKV